MACSTHANTPVEHANYVYLVLIVIIHMAMLRENHSYSVNGKATLVSNLQVVNPGISQLLPPRWAGESETAQSYLYQ